MDRHLECLAHGTDRPRSESTATGNITILNPSKIASLTRQLRSCVPDETGQNDQTGRDEAQTMASAVAAFDSASVRPRPRIQPPE